MPFQSEKQRRYLHANHPKIAKRWEKEYSNGGVLDITGDEQITTDEGNDISLVDESETGVSTLFMKKGGRLSINDDQREAIKKKQKKSYCHWKTNKIAKKM